MVNNAYKITFYDWVNSHIVGLEVEFATKLPTQKGFVPIEWRWTVERTFAWLNYFRKHSILKTIKKLLLWPKLGFFGQIAKLSLTVGTNHKT